jgi:hypothetical protein
MPSCKKCGQPIVWNHEDHEATGKWRPFDEETDEPHDCPSNYWGQGTGGGKSGIDAVDAISISASIIKLEDKMDELNKTMLKILVELQSVKIRLEGQMPLFSATESSVTATVVDNPQTAAETVALSEGDGN